MVTPTHAAHCSRRAMALCRLAAHLSRRAVVGCRPVGCCCVAYAEANPGDVTRRDITCLADQTETAASVCLDYQQLSYLFCALITSRILDTTLPHDVKSRKFR